jgi:hypothetical protein
MELQSAAFLVDAKPTRTMMQLFITRTSAFLNSHADDDRVSVCVIATHTLCELRE